MMLNGILCRGEQYLAGRTGGAGQGGRHSRGTAFAGLCCLRRALRRRCRRQGTSKCCPATLPTRISNARVLSHTATYDVASAI